MDQPKLGFIGCGRHATMCLYPSLEAAGIRLAAVCAAHLDHADSVAKKYDVPHAYDDYHQMLEKEHLDGVCVVVSEASHVQIVLDCLSAGVHVFVEKPVGSTVADAKRVADAADNAKKFVQVGYMKRFSPVYQKAKTLISDETRFGQLVSVQSTFTCRNFGFTDDRNFLLNAAIHNVDLLRLFCGEITDIRGFKRVIPEGVSYNFSFASANGVIGTMTIMALPPWAHRKEELILSGTRGFVSATELKNVTFHPSTTDVAAPRWQVLEEREERFASMDSTSSGGLQPLYLTGFVAELAAFAHAVSTGVAAPINTASENVKTMELCELILGSLQDPLSTS